MIPYMRDLLSVKQELVHLNYQDDLDGLVYLDTLTRIPIMILPLTVSFLSIWIL